MRQEDGANFVFVDTIFLIFEYSDLVRELGPYW